MPVDEKARHASQVIENDGDTAALKIEVAQAWAALTEPPPDPD